MSSEDLRASGEVNSTQRHMLDASLNPGTQDTLAVRKTLQFDQ